MADVAGQPRPDLTLRPVEAQAIGFFELLRRLERDELRFGRSGGPGREPARLGQRIRMTMATRDVAAVRAGEGNRRPEVDVEVLGLLGPEGPLPLHITRWVQSRLSERWFALESDRASADTAFLDFCNMLQHRMLALYWRAWADARPEVQAEFGEAGRVAALIDCLAGVALPGTQPATATPSLTDLKRRHATSLASGVQSPERLTRLLSDHLGAPVTLAEFVGEWVAIPPPLQSRLGQAFCGLGQGAVAGARSFQRQMRIELALGPMPVALYQRLLDDRGLAADLVHLVLFAIGRELDVDFRLVLRRAEIPDPRLGAARLGRTAWLSPRRDRDAGDLVLRAVTRPPTEEAA